jgi:protease-4
VNLTPVNSNKHADMLGMTRPLTADEVDYMQASVERIYTKFTELVAEGREMTVADVDAIAQGRVWAGSDALKIGLVDEIGTIEDAIRYAALSIEGVESLNDVQVAEYPKPQTALEAIMESLMGGENIFAELPFERGKVYARIPYDITIE